MCVILGSMWWKIGFLVHNAIRICRSCIVHVLLDTSEGIFCVFLFCTFGFIGLESPPHKLEKEVGEMKGERIFAYLTLLPCSQKVV